MNWWQTSWIRCSLEQKWACCSCVAKEIKITFMFHGRRWTACEEAVAAVAIMTVISLRRCSDVSWPISALHQSKLLISRNWLPVIQSVMSSIARSGGGPPLDDCMVAIVLFCVCFLLYYCLCSCCNTFAMPVILFFYKVILSCQTWQCLCQRDVTTQYFVARKTCSSCVHWSGKKQWWSNYKQAS